MTAKESIEVLRQSEYRDSLDPDADALPPRRVDGCTVVPLMNVGEQTFAGQVVEADYFVKCPANTDLLASDRVRIRGEVCEVRGRPADFGRKGVLFQARAIGRD